MRLNSNASFAAALCWVLELKRVIRRRLVLGIADGRMYADDELIYKATDLKVGLFIPEATEGAA